MLAIEKWLRKKFNVRSKCRDLRRISQANSMPGFVACVKCLKNVPRCSIHFSFKCRRRDDCESDSDAISDNNSNFVMTPSEPASIITSRCHNDTAAAAAAAADGQHSWPQLPKMWPATTDAGTLARLPWHSTGTTGNLRYHWSTSSVHTLKFSGQVGRTGKTYAVTTWCARHHQHQQQQQQQQRQQRSHSTPVIACTPQPDPHGLLTDSMNVVVLGS